MHLSRAARGRALSLLLLAVGAVVGTSIRSEAQIAVVEGAEARNYPAALGRRKGPRPPRLALELSATIALPGRLSGDAVVVSDGVASVPIAGGLAVSVLDAGAEARFASAPPAPATSPDVAWVVAPDGRRRFRSLPEGTILAEKRCARCRGGWKRSWTLRVAGGTSAPPLLRGRLLFFGSRDDRVYAVRADNGHRLWAVDVGDRVSRPLALWTGRNPAPNSGPESLELILVSPDGGGSVLALDPFDGSRIAVFELPADGGRIATPPAAAPDGRIVVGRERYVATESDLLVLSLLPARSEPAAAQDATDGRGGKLTGPTGGR